MLGSDINLFDKIINAIVMLEENEVEELVNEALKQGINPLEILNNALVVGINVVGDRFNSGEYFLPELICGASAMQRGLEIVKPLIKASGTNIFIGKVVMGTVSGDIHDIGKNIVARMLETAGFEVIDLGCDVPPTAFVDAVEKHEAKLIGLSTLLTTTMFYMQDTIEELNKRGLRDRVKVMVGGAVINQSFADRIGADSYAEDAASAVELAKRLIG